mgnify:FL=1
MKRKLTYKLASFLRESYSSFLLMARPTQMAVMYCRKRSDSRSTGSVEFKIRIQLPSYLVIRTVRCVVIVNYWY